MIALQVNIPENMEVGKQYPLMIWCMGQEAGAYEALIGKLQAHHVGVAFFLPGEDLQTEELAAKPFEKEQMACDALMEQVDTLCAERQWIDPERLHIGGSFFGAQVAAYALSQTSRFRTAVLGPGIFNPATAYGIGEVGPKPRQGETLQHFYEDCVRHSVLTKIDAMQTPILFLYDRADVSIGLSQVEEFYATMRDRNPDVACRMVISPENGPHMTELSDTFLQKIMDWVREDEHAC